MHSPLPMRPPCIAPSLCGRHAQALAYAHVRPVRPTAHTHSSKKSSNVSGSDMSRLPPRPLPPPPPPSLRNCNREARLPAATCLSTATSSDMPDAERPYAGSYGKCGTK
eukprot:17257-Chlamydomonas_euryale.AAC.1